MISPEVNFLKSLKISDNPLSPFAVAIRWRWFGIKHQALIPKPFFSVQKLRLSIYNIRIVISGKYINPLHSSKRDEVHRELIADLISMGTHTQIYYFL